MSAAAHHKKSSKQKFQPTQQVPPVASVPNPQLFNMHHFGSKIVTYRNVHPSESVYDEVCDLITNESIVVENIVEVWNPFLSNAFELKKAQMKALYGSNLREEYLFHGTKKEYVNDICTYNFDWRYYGQSTGHKFGKGVSFSPNAMYASNYSDADSYNKVMVVAKVLVGNACQGHEEMEVPPPGFDTSQKDDGIVIVKYEDNEFLPEYKLYYHIDDDSDDSYGDDDYDDSYDDDYDEDENDYDDDSYSDDNNWCKNCGYNNYYDDYYYY